MTRAHWLVVVGGEVEVNERSEKSFASTASVAQTESMNVWYELIIRQGVRLHIREHIEQLNRTKSLRIVQLKNV